MPTLGEGNTGIIYQQIYGCTSIPIYLSISLHLPLCIVSSNVLLGLLLFMFHNAIRKCTVLQIYFTVASSEQDGPWS